MKCPGRRSSLICSADLRLGIKDNASNAVQAAADKYAELTTFMSDMDSQLGALLKESKDALDAGKKGFSEDLPKVLFAVGKA